MGLIRVISERAFASHPGESSLCLVGDADALTLCLHEGVMIVVLDSSWHHREKDFAMRQHDYNFGSAITHLSLASFLRLYCYLPNSI